MRVCVCFVCLQLEDETIEWTEIRQARWSGGTIPWRTNDSRILLWGDSFWKREDGAYDPGDVVSLSTLARGRHFPFVSAPERQPTPGQQHIRAGERALSRGWWTINIFGYGGIAWIWSFVNRELECDRGQQSIVLQQGVHQGSIGSC